MKLRALNIQRLSGIRPGFVLDGLDAGINVVVGPNASGKSSLMRALRAVLYREEQRGELPQIEATFDAATGALTAIRSGAELRWEQAGRAAEPPPLPEHRFLPCFTLGIEDLLAEDGSTDRDIAERLARELAGGYDLGAVRADPRLSPNRNRGRNETRQLNETRGTLRRTQREQNALQQQEAQLGELRRERDEAHESERQAQAYDKALALLEAQRHRIMLETQVNEFPQDMEQLRGDELDTLKRLTEEKREQNAMHERAREERADADKKLAESKLAETELDEAAIEDRRAQIQRLQRIETRVEQRHEALEEATADHARAYQAMGGDVDHLPKLQPETIHQVEQQLEEKRRLDALIRQLDVQLQRLPEHSEDAVPPETLHMARRHLLEWLSAPRAVGSKWARRTVIAAVGIASVAGILIAGIAVHWVFSFLVIPVLVGLAWLFFSPISGDSERRTAYRQFIGSGVAEPQAWDRERVSSRLRALDRELRDAEKDLAARTRRSEIGGERAAQVRELDALQEALAGRAADVGFAPQHLDASLDRWINMVADYDSAAKSMNAVQATLSACSEEASNLRRSLISFARDYNEAPKVEEPDAEVLGEGLRRLHDRVRRREGAIRQIKAAEQRIENSKTVIDELAEKISKLYISVGLTADDETTLRQRLDKRKTWVRLMDELRQARTVEREREQALGERSELVALVEANEETPLQDQRDKERAKAARSDTLLRKIAQIEERIERAAQRRELENARAKQQGAEDALRDRLAEALFAQAGAYLLDQVAHEHVQASQPAALRRAAEWFKRFTHHQYELIFAPDGAHRFAARESASAERRALSELSSGTRMQLLLAVRIAFALQAERGRESLPLLLDEALTTADPERFRAAADSLRTLAHEDGRQVFYLTAQPGDIAYWQAQDIDIHCIDLAKVRRAGAAITDSTRIAMTASHETPAPDGRSPESYAVALGVPALDPWADAAGTHIFYLLRDDLDLLHWLLENGIEHLGQLQSLLKSDQARVLLDEAQQKYLRARVAATETWFDAWRIGHGRPVDRQALMDSAAISETFMDNVCALSEEVGNRAEGIIEQLSDGRVKGFRANKRDELREWCLQNGYLDERGALTKNEIQRRVLTVLANGQNKRTALDEARSLSASLFSGLSNHGLPTERAV